MIGAKGTTIFQANTATHTIFISKNRSITHVKIILNNYNKKNYFKKKTTKQSVCGEEKNLNMKENKTIKILKLTQIIRFCES